MSKKLKPILLILLVSVILIWLLRKSVITPPLQEPQVVVQTNASIKSETTNITSHASIATMPGNEFQEIQAHVEQVKREDERIISLARSPIIYYGKVVDESNQPISGVHVSYTAHTVNETPEDVFNPGSVTSDKRGIFKIDGINGIGLLLEISHPDYYPYPENSTGFDKRSRPRDGIVEDSEAHARIFRMHSKGCPVPLVHRADGMNVLLDSVAKALDLRGADYKQKIGQLVVEAAGTPPPHYNQQPFDWAAKITVPDGGLIEYTNQFDFVAPDSGYQSSVEFSFPKETVGWTDTVSKNFFVKLPSGYARLNIYIGAKRPLFFSVEYDYNPDGSQNLERAR